MMVVSEQSATAPPVDLALYFEVLAQDAADTARLVVALNALDGFDVLSSAFAAPGISADLAMFASGWTVIVLSNVDRGAGIDGRDPL